MFRKILFILALLVFLASGGYLGYHYYEAYKEDSAFDELKTKNGHDLVALHKQNSDIVGWIKVDGTNIDYPVVQTPDDPEFYLRRNFKKEHSVAGTPFMDAYSKIGKSKNYLIYGHNIKAGTMFHELLEFEEKKFWKEHQYFQYDELRNGKQVKGVYKIVAFFRSEILAKRLPHAIHENGIRHPLFREPRQWGSHERTGRHLPRRRIPREDHPEFRRF